MTTQADPSKSAQTKNIGIYEKVYLSLLTYLKASYEYWAREAARPGEALLCRAESRLLPSSTTAQGGGFKTQLIKIKQVHKNRVHTVQGNATPHPKSLFKKEKST
jgi:hypothetical protein